MSPRATPDRATEGGHTEGLDLVDMYRSGSSLQALADETGRSRWWIRKHLAAAGVAIRARGGPQAGPSSEELEQLRQLYVTLEQSPAEIAARLQRSTSWVGLHLQRMGIERRRSRRSINGDLEDEVLRRYIEHGESMNAIANAIDASPGAVRTVLVANDVKIRRRSASYKIDCDMLAKLYLDEGLSTPAIAARLKVSTSGVSCALDRCQITKRSPVPFEISDAALERLYVDERLDDDAIAERFGASVWAVNQRRRAAGIRRPPGFHAHPAPDAADLRRLYVDQGKTLSDIATKYRVPHAAVRRWLTHAGLIDVDPAQRSRPAGIEILVADLERLYVDEELTAAEVGAALGVSKRVVLRNLHAHGLPVRPPGARRPAPDQTVIQALYADEEVLAVLRSAHIEQRPQHGDLRSRWPQPADLTTELLDQLYLDLGLSGAHISLLTGHTETKIRNALQQAGIATRSGGRSPWTRRQQGEAR